MDCRHEPSKDDYTMLDYLSYHRIPFVIALTKGDKLNKTESLAAKGKFEEFCKEFSYSDIIFTSAEKNIGIDTLLDRFEKELAE